MKNKKLIKLWMKEHGIHPNEEWILFHSNEFCKEEICKVKITYEEDIKIYEHNYLYGWQQMAYPLLGAMLFCEDFTLEKI